MKREVWITGYGLLSPLGETPAEWWHLLADPATCRARVDSDSYKPFHVYPTPEVDLSLQVTRPGDQRAMGPMMQYGAYAAGLALDMAHVKGDEALLLNTHLLAAAGGGERDIDLDAQILGRMPETNDKQAMINQELADGLRPTLFLAQLPNLFAGNISIIHGVAGSSRTFMGEESAGADAVRVGFQRVAAGQGDIFLIGAAYNAARPDLHQLYHAGGVLMHAPFADLWARPDAGLCLGSAGAFLVLEAGEHARNRGVAPIARLSGIESHRSPLNPGSATSTARKQFDALVPELGDGPLAVLSGASGAGSRTSEEHAFLSALASEGPTMAVRGTAQVTGHAMEAAFLQNLVLGICALEQGTIFPPLSSDPLENLVPEADIEQVLITGWGHAKGEAMALLEKANG